MVTGYGNSVLLFIVMLASVYVAYRFLNFNAIAAFWCAYVLTRPLGASTGDLLSQTKADGGLGLGATVTSCIFLAAILAVVVFLSKTKRDQLLVA